MSTVKKITLLLLLTCLIPFIIVNYLDYTRAVDLIETKSIKTLTVYARHQALNLHNNFVHMREEVRRIAKMSLLSHKTPDFINAYQLDGADSKQFRELSLVFEEALTPVSEVNDYYDLFIITPHADIIFSIKKEADLLTNLVTGDYKNTGLAHSFKSAMRLENLSMSGFKYYEPTGKPAAFMAEAIIKQGKIIAVLAIQFNVAKMYEITQAYLGQGQTGEVIIASHIGNQALILNVLRHDARTAFKRSINIGSTQSIPIQLAVQGHSGSGIYTDYRDKEVLAAWSYLPFPRLGMVVKQDVSEAYADVNYLRNWAFLSGFIIFSLIIYIALIIAQIVHRLDATRKQYEYAINGTNDGLWDWDIKSNHIFYSKRWKAMLGYTDSEVLNKFDSWSERIHPDDLKETLDAINYSLEKPGRLLDNIHRLRHKDNSWVWVLNRAQTIFDLHGSAIRMVGFHTDISSIKRLESKLLQETRRVNNLGEILESSLNEIYIFNQTDFHFLYANKGSLQNIGYSLSTLKTMTPVDLKPYLDMEQFKEIIKPLENHEVERIKLSTTFQRQDGTKYPIDSHVQLINYGEQLAYVAIIVDTSEREKALQELHEREEIMLVQSRHAAMGEMIGMIAHQWRQPITVIAMGANNILADIDLDEIEPQTLKEQAYAVLKQTEYLSKTIDDFRNFFRPDKNKEEVWLGDVLKEAENIIGKSLENNRIALTIKNKPHDKKMSKKINTYSRELLQVYINLLKNAKESLVENRAEQRKIDIVITDDEHNVITHIYDNGGGIDKSIINRIFDPYFSTKDRKTGTGLGLYMSKTIIEKHLCGTITIENVNEGACVTTSIPIINPSDSNE